MLTNAGLVFIFMRVSIGMRVTAMLVASPFVRSQKTAIRGGLRTLSAGTAYAPLDPGKRLTDANLVGGHLW